ncbi:glycosyltransferase [Rhodococcus hoagii]|nr:glycosyltransferase [Prescottella equi]
MSLIIVTPIHNEEANIGVLAEQIAESTLKPDLWIVVDDGSTDRGAEMIRAMEHPMETVVLRRDNAGGLIGGSPSPRGSSVSTLQSNSSRISHTS